MQRRHPLPVLLIDIKLEILDEVFEELVVILIRLPVHQPAPVRVGILQAGVLAAFDQH